MLGSSKPKTHRQDELWLHLDIDHMHGDTYLRCYVLIVGPVIFRFKKSNFRFVIGNVEFDEITIYWKKVRQNGTISAVNGRKRALTHEWTIKEAPVAQSTLCVDNKNDKTAKSHVWLSLKKMDFHGLRFKSAIPRILRLFRDRGKSLALGLTSSEMKGVSNSSVRYNLSALHWDATTCEDSMRTVTVYTPCKQSYHLVSAAHATGHTYCKLCTHLVSYLIAWSWRPM